MYEKLQFISYDVYTGPAFFNGKKRYVGKTSEAEDIGARLGWTKGVLQEAQRRSTISKEKTVLKLLMLPEFYFRGANGAYSLEQLDQLMDGLQNLIADKTWEDWIFVFGTAVGVSSPATDMGAILRKLFAEGDDEEEEGARFEVDPDAVKEIYNVCLIQKGGWNSDDIKDRQQKMQLRADAARIVMKEFKSNIDFIEVTDLAGSGLAWHRVAHLEACAVGVNKEKQRVNYDGGGVFQMSGINFGLEICLDHDAQRLRNSPSLQRNEQVQIQLVPSCGMFLCPASIVAVEKGYAFNVDGYTTSKGEVGGHHSQLQQVEHSYSLMTQAELGKEIEPIKPIEPLPEELTIDEGSTRLTIAAKTIFAKGPGQLTVYTPVSVPALA